MKRAVFMGSDTFSVPILAALLEAGGRLSVPVAVAAVVTQPDRPAGRGRKVVTSPVKQLATGARVPVLQPERVRNPEAVQEILATGPDLIVVASYGQILPSSLLDDPPNKALNLHPSLLPRYRGPSPIAAAILAGETVTGTTLMLMSPRMDAGPILDQTSIEIEPHETAAQLASRLAEESARLLLADLPAWLEGDLELRPQDESRATYTEKVRKEDGVIDWSRTAEEIERTTRAYTPWPGAVTGWAGRQLKLLEARADAGSREPGLVEVSAGGRVTIGTGDGLLEIRRLQLAGGKPLEVREFVGGYPGIQGARLG